MKKKILTIVCTSITAFFSYGQSEKLIVDSLIVNTGCLGLSYKIVIKDNLYLRNTSDAMYGASDTLINLSVQQVSFLNKEISNIKKVKGKDRIKKVNNSCPCYREIIIVEFGQKNCLGKYISTSRPPGVFRKIDKLIEEIE